MVRFKPDITVFCHCDHYQQDQLVEQASRHEEGGAEPIYVRRTMMFEEKHLKCARWAAIKSRRETPEEQLCCLKL